MTGRAVAWLGLAFWAACTGPSDGPELPVAEEASVGPVAAVRPPFDADLTLPSIRVHAHRVRLDPIDGGGWSVGVDARFTLDRAPSVAGLASTVRPRLVEPRQLTLRVDGVPRPVRIVGEGGREGAFTLDPVTGWHASVALETTVDAGAAPTEVVLTVADEGNRGVAELFALGPPRLPGEDGGPALAITLVDPAGRGVVADLPLERVSDEGAVAAVRPAEGGLARLPVGDPTARIVVRLPDGRTVDVPAPSEPGVVRVALPPEPGGDPLAEHGLPAPEDALGDPVLRLADRLGDPAGVARFVREEIGVLPTSGIGRSVTQVLDLGAGSPIERALLALALVEAQGHVGRFVCGDLPPDHVRALYRGPASAPAAGAGAAALSAARDAARALAPALGEAWRAAGERPERTRHERFDLLPEWCWVQTVDGPRDTPVVTDLDLRAAPYDRLPLPATWRLATAPRGDTWRVRVTLYAMARRPGGDVETVELVAYDGDMSGLGEHPFAFSATVGEDGFLGSRMRSVSDRALQGREGRTVLADQVEGLFLGVLTDDPRGVDSPQLELDLWRADSGGALPRALPRALTVAVSSDAGAADDGAVWRALARTRAAVHPAPDVQSLVALNRWHAQVAHHAAEGLVAAVPTLRLQTLALTDDGLHRQVHVLPPGPVAWVADPPDDAVRGRYAAGLRIADAVVAGEDPAAVPAPAAWSGDVREIHTLPGFDPAWHGTWARALGRGWWVGTEPDGTTWATSPDDGAIGPVRHGLGPRVDHPRGVPTSLDAVAIRCLDLDRWRAWAGVDDRRWPEACAARFRPAPSGDSGDGAGGVLGEEPR